MVFVALLVNSQ